MAFAPKILGHKPRGKRGERLVERARERRGMIVGIPTSDNSAVGKVGAVPVMGLENPYRNRPFFAFEPARVRGDGKLQPTTGPAVKADVIPIGARNYRKRVANARAGLAAKAADGAGLEFAKGRNQNPVADTVPTKERQTTMGERQIPGQITVPFTLQSAGVAIDARVYQGAQTAGLMARRFF